MANTTFSLLIPFQPGCKERGKTHRWLRKYYEAGLPEAEIVVAGDDTGDKALNRSRMRNNCVKLATTDRFVFIDADALLPLDLIRKIAELSGPTSTMVQPSHAIWINEANTAAVLKQKPDAGFPDVGPRGELLFDPPRTLLGLVFGIHRANLEQLGGWDERFRGWGEEDPSFRLAVRCMLGAVNTLPDGAYHLWHPRTAEHSHITPEFQRNYYIRMLYEKAANQLDKQFVRAILTCDLDDKRARKFWCPLHRLNSRNPCFRLWGIKWRGDSFVTSDPVQAAILLSGKFPDVIEV